jgi:3-hydroxybutyryl-CoA dehydrogenase
MIKTIAVIGGGTMGHGIAGCFALHGFPVRLCDVSDQILAHGLRLIAEELQLLADEEAIPSNAVAATLERVTAATDLAETVRGCDYVIEAVLEKIEIKHELLRQLDALAPAHAIIASNTSSLPLEAMASVLPPERRARFAVNHWFNPAHLIPLVELSFFGNMPEALFAEIEALYAAIGKQTIRVLKDVPGLVANRIQQGVAREVFSLLERGVAAPGDIDKALKFGPAFRYATTGQLEVADFGGLDIWCIVGDNLLKDMDDSRESNPFLRAKVAEGKLGAKTGEGIFSYPAEKVGEIRRGFMRRLIRQLKASMFYR